MIPSLATRVPALRHAFLVTGAFVSVILVTTGMTARGEIEKAEARAADSTARVGGDRAPRAPSRGEAPLVLGDSLFGYSGAVGVRLLAPEEAREIPGLVNQFGAGALRAPAVLTVAASSRGAPFSFITVLPWREKQGAFVGAYHVGWWPGERTGGGRAPSGYALPTGFVEVTRENVGTRLSTHFRLSDFVTHDQVDVWPKYVVLREALLDKLELVLADLAAHGVPARHVVVLSGFRSPEYNARGAGEGMAPASRHQYGDAADIIIDDDYDGRMDDLNGDGRVDFADTDVIERAVERVEQRYPDLVGGLGLYHEVGPSGPFAHIDVRGSRARWSNDAAFARSRAASVATPRYAGAYPSAAWSADRRGGERAERVGPSGCSATGASALLCKGSR